MAELLGFLTVLCIVGSIVAIEKRIDRVRNTFEMRIRNLEKELKELKKERVNPVFIILVLLGAAALWFLLSFLFRPLGNLITKIWRDAADEINKNDDEEKED